VTFAPEEDALNVTFTILDDDIVEAPEAVQLTLMPGDGERGVIFPAATSVVNGLILDDNDSESVTSSKFYISLVAHVLLL